MGRMQIKLLVCQSARSQNGERRFMLVWQTRPIVLGRAAGRRAPERINLPAPVACQWEPSITLQFARAGATWPELSQAARAGVSARL